MTKFLARLGGASRDALPELPFVREFFNTMILCFMVVVMTFGVGMVVVFVLEAGVKGVLNLTDPSLKHLLFEAHPNGLWATEQLVGHTIDLLVAIAMFYGITQIKPQSLVWLNRTRSFAFIRVLAGVALAYVIYRGALYVVFDYFQVGAGQPAGPQTSRAMQLTFGERIPMLVSTLIVSPILEEVLFRGYVYNLLRTSLRHAWAKQPEARKQLFCAEVVSLFMSAALFAMLHAFGASPTGVLQVMIGSVVLTLLYRFSGSLLAPITLHFVLNGMIWYHMLSQ